VLAAFLVYASKDDVRFNFKAPPAASPPERAFPYRKFYTLSEAKRFCGKNKITHTDEITPTESRDAGVHMFGQRLD
jgi:hypothetical protein